MTDETVIVVHSAHGGRKERFHTDEDCRYLEDASTADRGERA